MTSTTITTVTVRRTSNWFEPTCVALLALLALGGFEYLVQSAGEDSRRYLDDSGRMAFTAARVGLSALVILIVVRSFDLRETMHRYWPVLALTSYYCASYYWSVDSEATAGSAVRLVAILAIGIWVAGDGRPDQIMRRLGVAVVIFVAVNVAATLAFFDLSFMRGLHEGAWRGALSHKNAIAFNLTFAGVIALCRFLDTGRVRWLALCGICWSGIILSQSASAAVVSAFGLVLVLTLYVVATLVSRPFLPAVLLACAALCVVSIPWMLGLSEVVSTSVGRGITFTGRTTIWNYAIAAAERGGLFGYGYQAFWSDLQAFGGIYRTWGASWSPVHAHNGLLDAWLAGGSIGLPLVLVLLLLALKRGYDMASCAGPVGTRLFPLVAVICLFMYNMVETVFPSSSTLAFSLIAVVLGMRPSRVSS